jgi:hypothetical protein
MTDSVPEREGATAFAFGLRGLTFELTPTAEAGCARREVEHKQARFAAGTACRSGSGAERGVRPQRDEPHELGPGGLVRADSLGLPAQ